MEPDSQQTPAGTTLAASVKMKYRFPYIRYVCVLLFSFLWFYISISILNSVRVADGLQNIVEATLFLSSDRAIRSRAFLNFVWFDWAFNETALGLLLPVFCALQITRIKWIKQALFSFWMYRAAVLVVFAFSAYKRHDPFLIMAAVYFLCAAFTFKLLRDEKKSDASGRNGKPVSRKFAAVVTAALIIGIIADAGYGAGLYVKLREFENHLRMKNRAQETIPRNKQEYLKYAKLDPLFLDPLTPSEDKKAAALIEKDIAPYEDRLQRAVGKGIDKNKFNLFFMKSALADIYCYKLYDCKKAIKIDKELEEKYNSCMGSFGKAQPVKTGWHYYRLGDLAAARRYALRAVNKKTKLTLKTPRDTADFYRRMESKYYRKTVFRSEMAALHEIKNKNNAPRNPHKPKSVK